MLSLIQAIHISQQDLGNYSADFLKDLARYLQLDTKSNVDDLRWLIAIKLISPRYQKVRMPNNGDREELLKAVQEGHTEIVKSLLKTGNAHPEYQDKDGFSALILAAVNGYTNIVELLLKTGNAHPEYQDNDGISALMLAVGDPDIIKLLLDTGEAHPEYQDDAGNTALISATTWGSTDIVELLLATGDAHPEYKNNDGKTAMDLARQGGYSQIIKLLMRASALAQAKPVAPVEKPVPAAAEDCSNETDLITTEEWSEDNLPNVKIRFLDKDLITKKPYVYCTDRDSLQQWLKIPKHEFRGWIPKEGFTMDVAGHYGAPSSKEIFYRLIDGNFIDNNPAIFTEPVDDFTGIPVYTNKRLGNPQGIFGIGQHHGQTPGFTVYHLVDSTKFNKETLEKLYDDYHQFYYQEPIASSKRAELEKMSEQELIKTIQELTASRLGEMWKLEHPIEVTD